MIKARNQLKLSLKNLIVWEQSHPMIILIFFSTLEEKKKLYAPTAELYINTLVKMVRPPGVEPGRCFHRGIFLPSTALAATGTRPVFVVWTFSLPYC